MARTTHSSAHEQLILLPAIEPMRRRPQAIAPTGAGEPCRDCGGVRLPMWRVCRNCWTANRARDRRREHADGDLTAAA
jgi:hypothetical protein